MTTIRKLSLQGVRSYSDKQAEVIEFFQPLTIIVGPNGCGKTTIIEALKFACTGQQPPLSDGGKSFVHDPKIEGTSIVKAQIKLGFKTTQGTPVLAIRSFQLTQKKQVRQYKQVESVLRTLNAAGKQVSLSHRCSDMEKLVPHLMGVSKAVLENVIFCHQEDSNWPLSDSKSLKGKFDDIFAATRYTKAVEVIRKLRKDKSSDIKDLEARLIVLERDMEHAHKLEDDLEVSQKRIAGRNKNIEELTRKENAIKEQLAKLGEKAGGVEELRKKVQSMEAEAKIMHEEKKKAHDRMNTEYNDSDEHLQQYFDKFVSQMRDFKAKLEHEQSRQAEATAKLASMSAQDRELTKQLGQVEEQALAYSRKQKDLANVTSRLVTQFNLVQHDRKDDQFDYDDFQLQLEQSVETKQSQWSTYKRDQSRDDSAFESKLSSIKDKQTKLKSELHVKARRCAEMQDKSKRAGDQLKAIISRIGGSVDVQADVRRAQNELKDFEAKDTAERIKEEIEQKKRQQRSNQGQLTVLSSERRQLDSQKEAVTQLKFKRDSLEKLRRTHNASLDNCKRDIVAARIPLDRPPMALPEAPALEDALNDHKSEGLETMLREQLLRVRDERKREEEKLTRATASLAEIEGQVRRANDDIVAADKKILQARDDLKKVDGELSEEKSTGLQEKIESHNKQLDKLKQEQMLSSSAQLIYKKFIATAKENHNCPLCSRALEAAEHKDFLDNLQAKVDRVSSDAGRQAAKEAISKTKQRLDLLRGLTEAWALLQRMRDERPALRERYTALKKSEKDAQRSVSDARADVKTVADREESVRELLKVATEITRHHNEMVDLLKSIKHDAARLESRSAAAGGRSLDIVQREYEELERTTLQLNTDMSSLQEQLESLRTQRQSLTTKYNQWREKGLEVERLTGDRERLEKEKKEADSEYKDVMEQGRDIESQIKPLSEQLEQVTREREANRAKQRRGEETLLKSLTDVQREADAFRSLVEEVREYERKSDTRRGMQATLERSKGEIDRQREATAQLTKSVTTIEQKLAKGEMTYQDIQANIEYRDRKRKIDAHTERLAASRKQLADLTGDEQLFTNISDYKEEQRKLSIKCAELRGSNKSDQEQSNTASAELKTERYKGVDERYRGQQIAHRTNVMASTDLDVYMKALDKALIQFHQAKMKEINEVLREYWRATYSGKDIDEVYICSDHTVKESGRRNYNYRVVMRQGDTELDMRGRCSAGQKVLASLLIRLALAETFCLQCGVLALDEPTTNLDAANVRAFARALNTIISKRREQKNFQLILITHDESFIDEIGKRAHADFYYRVGKDVNNNSVIRRHAIRDDADA